MPRGHPDWNLPPGQVGVSQLGDLAELAVRLGSIVSYERSGNVVFSESFEAGYQRWWFSCSAGVAKYRLTADRVKSGGYALALYPNQGVNGSCGVRRTVPLPIFGKLGLEFSAAPGTKITGTTFGMVVYDGVKAHNFYIAYRWVDNWLRILRDDNKYYTFAEDVDLSGWGNPFHTFKLVIDMVKERYDRLFVNQAEYDLREYAVYENTDPADPRVDLVITAWQDTADNPFLAVDDVIFTQNEP